MFKGFEKRDQVWQTETDRTFTLWLYIKTGLSKLHAHNLKFFYRGRVQHDGNNILLRKNKAIDTNVVAR
jgi:hypothetical protein